MNFPHQQSQQVHHYDQQRYSHHQQFHPYYNNNQIYNQQPYNQQQQHPQQHHLQQPTQQHYQYQQQPNYQQHQQWNCNQSNNTYTHHQNRTQFQNTSRNKMNQNSNRHNINLNHKTNAVSSCRCEPCDKDFTSQNALEAHKKTHVQCEFSGCVFIASSKAVKLHFIQTHEEGRFRICLTTPEEIKKWREERKRNWPTQSNVERKKVKTDEDQKNGVNISTKEYVYQERGHGRRQRGGVRERRRGSGYNKHLQKNKSQQINTEDSSQNVNSLESNMHHGNELIKQDDQKNGNTSKQTVTSGYDIEDVTVHSQPITGLALLKGYTDDEENVGDEHSEEVVSNKDTGNPGEGGGEEENVEMNNVDGNVDSEIFSKRAESINFEKCANNDVVDVNNNKESAPEIQNNKQPSPPEDGGLEKEDGELNSDDADDGELVHVDDVTDVKQDPRVQRHKSNNRMRKHKGKQNNNKNQLRGPKRKVSLLEMLLSNEIRHERNVVLQCVRYIVQQDFFMEKK